MVEFLAVGLGRGERITQSAPPFCLVASRQRHWGVRRSYGRFMSGIKRLYESDPFWVSTRHSGDQQNFSLIWDLVRNVNSLCLPRPGATTDSRGGVPVGRVKSPGDYQVWVPQVWVPLLWEIKHATARFSQGSTHSRDSWDRISSPI